MSALVLMLIVHALADYPLQGDWLSKAKNPRLDLASGEIIWPGALACHSGIHAGGVWLVTQSWSLSAAEFISHCLTDYAKCTGRINYNQDQAIHILCKCGWASALFWGIA